MGGRWRGGARRCLEEAGRTNGEYAAPVAERRDDVGAEAIVHRVELPGPAYNRCGQERAAAAEEIPSAAAAREVHL